MNSKTRIFQRGYLIVSIFSATALSAIAQQQTSPGSATSPSAPGAQQGELPPGLEKRDELPPGLQRDQLPPGLAKRTNQVDNATNNVGGTATNSDTTVGGGSQTNAAPGQASSQTNAIAGQTNAVGGAGTNYDTLRGFGRGTNAPWQRSRTNAFQPGSGGTAEGAATTTTGGASATANVNITVVNNNFQPMATEIRRVIVAEPALVSALPGVAIQIQDGGVVNLSGQVSCPAEGVLLGNIIQQKVRGTRVINTIRAEGR